MGEKFVTMWMLRQSSKVHQYTGCKITQDVTQTTGKQATTIIITKHQTTSS